METQKIISGLKNIAYWTIPPGIQHVVYCQVRSILGKKRISKELKQMFSDNKKFHNIHKDDRCFILGTGPSINKQNLLPLKDEICISISNFFLHPDARKIDPLYHTFAPQHPPNDFNTLLKEFTYFKANSSERTRVFLGHTTYEYSHKNFLDQFPEWRPKYYNFINYNSALPIDEKNYTDPKIWDISANPFSIRTGLYLAIQIAAYMGFKEIYLLGIDHDFINNSSTKTGATHFYDLSSHPVDDGYLYTKERIFLGFYYRWMQYRLMRDYLNSKGILIYNATEGGILDVFPCISLSDALSSSRDNR